MTKTKELLAADDKYKNREWQFKVIKKPRHVYGDQLVCLAALTVMAVWRCGWRALALVVTGVLIALLCDWICCHMTKKEYNPKDLSTIATGMCLALLLPVSSSYIMVGCAAAFAIGVKHIFGGKDNYIFNPTAVSLAFLIICFPSEILLYPKVGEIIPTFGADLSTVVTSSGIESALVRIGTAEELSILDVLLGSFQGAMGTTHVLVLLVCALCLLFRRSISALVTLISLGVCVFVSFTFPLRDGFTESILYELIGGYTLFGILFLANDPQTLPKSILGRVFYGIVVGSFAMIFRYFAKTEGAFIFSILLSNAVSLGLDRLGDHVVSGIVAIGRGIKNGALWAKSSMGSFERQKNNADKPIRSIGDTQEIIIPSVNFNMPPIDNKVTKVTVEKKKILGIKAPELFKKSVKKPKIPESSIPLKKNTALPEEIKAENVAAIPQTVLPVSTRSRRQITRTLPRSFRRPDKNVRIPLKQPGLPEKMKKAGR